MWKTLALRGTEISRWPGVQVWQGNRGIFVNITATWDWSDTVHEHYQVARVTKLLDDIVADRDRACAALGLPPTPWSTVPARDPAIKGGLQP